MGPGESASEMVRKTAFELGKTCGQNGWITLTGGRDSGVMDAALHGARQAGGLTMGILPDESGSGASSHIGIAIKTGMGQSRNVINVLTANVVVGVGLGPGTSSEISLAVKFGKPVVLLEQDEVSISFFKSLSESIHICDSVKDSERLIKRLLRDHR